MLKSSPVTNRGRPLAWIIEDQWGYAHRCCQGFGDIWLKVHHRKVIEAKVLRGAVYSTRIHLMCYTKNCELIRKSNSLSNMFKPFCTFLLKGLALG
jgi:hypothetical protein